MNAPGLRLADDEAGLFVAAPLFAAELVMTMGGGSSPAGLSAFRELATSKWLTVRGDVPRAIIRWWSVDFDGKVQVAAALNRDAWILRILTLLAQDPEEQQSGEYRELIVRVALATAKRGVIDNVWESRRSQLAAGWLAGELDYPFVEMFRVYQEIIA